MEDLPEQCKMFRLTSLDAKSTCHFCGVNQDVLRHCSVSPVEKVQVEKLTCELVSRPRISPALRVLRLPTCISGVECFISLKGNWLVGWLIVYTFACL
jgi:hypothetical protein